MQEMHIRRVLVAAAQHLFTVVDASGGTVKGLEGHERCG